MLNKTSEHDWTFIWKSFCALFYVDLLFSGMENFRIGDLRHIGLKSLNPPLPFEGTHDLDIGKGREVVDT
jgi:hypothetical protein